VPLGVTDARAVDAAGCELKYAPGQDAGGLRVELADRARND